MNILKAEQKDQQKKEKQKKVESKKGAAENNNNDEEKKRKRKLSGRMEVLEKELSKAKQQKEVLEKHLSNPGIYSDPDKFKTALDEFNTHESRFKVLTKEWEEVFEELSAIE